MQIKYELNSIERQVIHTPADAIFMGLEIQDKKVFICFESIQLGIMFTKRINIYRTYRYFDDTMGVFLGAAKTDFLEWFYFSPNIRNQHAPDGTNYGRSIGRTQAASA